uniref:Uncharacterized protein n=1 Tax=Tanacetum cinerariifolium TaxID=118510 RepID=A0A699RIF9_TANCI|nr:hypothetical protein [Tanacetum cinerariifolium]
MMRWRSHWSMITQTNSYQIQKKLARKKRKRCDVPRTPFGSPPPQPPHPPPRACASGTPGTSGSSRSSQFPHLPLLHLLVHLDLLSNKAVKL